MARHDRSLSIRRGFTLIEMAVVVAIVAILAAAFIPDLIEAARTRMAEKAAEDVGKIQSAAQWYFAESVNLGAPDEGRWPGEGTSPLSAVNGNRTCVARAAPDSAQDQLIADGYLQPAAFANPWNTPYFVRLTPGAAVPTEVCAFSVSTALPTVIANSFRSFLPQAACVPNNDCLAAAAVPGTSCCTSTIPKPGAEASFKYLTDTWIPQNVYSATNMPVMSYSGCGACTAAGGGVFEKNCIQREDIETTSFPGNQVHPTTITGPCKLVFSDAVCAATLNASKTTCRGVSM